ncbi:MAG: Structural maintenance of chromosomes protein 1 [Claussenomyces sp. TS43310]|nr:MAG: Structural maintenance of chromosomes protein 1 [Claussenomyces sp. TS43310]
MGKLIRLELNNFKSYKGHHTLLFGDSYFTSIIGPNGSGKSNSMDAISFVLGIKSSHLRSAHLKDLVYRGRVLKTSKINDDGSAETPATNGHANGTAGLDDPGLQPQRTDRNDPKTAWVMAVYEDDAGDEQKWKRVITNSGASEYRINDRLVTAQQYNEALEAENILIKARNFLVFQGDVEAIASQSPKDLTRLIEQISGSLEYKAEYERLEGEAEQASENQNYHLHRRRGINSEIKQWQEQKKEAENYENKADERDNAIVTHILWKLYHFQKVMEESGAEIQRHQEELKEFHRGIEKYEKALDDARKDQARVQKDVSRVERSIKAKEREIEETENSLIPIDEKIDQSKSGTEKIRRRLESLIKERNEQSAAVASVKKELAVVEKAQKHFETEWKETLKKQGKQLSESDLKEYNKLRAEVISRTSANQAKLDNLLRQLKTDEVTVSSLKGKVEASEAQVDKLAGEVDYTTQRKQAVNESVKAISKDIDGKKKEFNSLQSERLRTNQKHTELDEKLQEVMKKLLEAADGKRQSDREMRTKEMVTSLKRIFPGVRGRVGELCKPKQKKFDEAVITALGRDFDSVIVDTEKTGTECVQYLKDQRFGPMTFIPLDNIKVSAVNSSLKGLPKARLTIDTIDFDASLERAMSYACGSSIVCDDLVTAKHICYDKGTQVKAVTLEGFVIHKAGLMTGGRGAEGKGSKRRFEEHDIQNLEKMKDKLIAELESLPKANRKGTVEEQLQSDLAGLDQRLTYAKSELAAFEQNLASKKKELDHEKRHLKEIKPKFNQKSAELESIQSNVKKVRDAVSEVEDKVCGPFCQRLGYENIRAYEAQQGSLEQEMSQKRSDFEVQKQRLVSRQKWDTSQLTSTEQRVARLEEQLESQEQGIATYERQKATLEDALDVKNAELETLNEQLNEQKAKLAKKTDKVTDARNELHKRSKDVDSTTKAITSLETEIQRNSAGRYALLRRCKLEQIQIPLEEGSKGLDSLPVDSVLQADPDAMDVDEDLDADLQAHDYGIEVDYEELADDLKESDEEHIEEQLRAKIDALNAELEKLNPNMRAVDRLDEVESRLKSTEKDFEDSRRAAKGSRDAFNDVKEKRFDLFNKAFSHISEQISHVYKDLTRSATFPLGGQAYLDIEDSDAPYLSGIKYHAMPPLKRFRDMEHLSGGEKTMAALALLFAVHSYQPSPFFVLDEVDAALDNANVEKIRNYIREHAGPGMQFIVISLKTGLFQGSESLVGVYRDQDANSSNTLTLDLRKYQ